MRTRSSWACSPTPGQSHDRASVALRVLAEARQDGLSDKEIIARSPSVLALTGPRVAPEAELPEEATAVYVAPGCKVCSDNGILREALRMRVRGCRRCQAVPPGSWANGWPPPVT